MTSSGALTARGNVGFLYGGSDRYFSPKTETKGHQETLKLTAIPFVKKILLVDDNQYLHELMGRVLNFMGHDIISAVIANEGLQKAISEKPDLIVLDIDLPDMDGRDAARLLRLNPATQHIPILALTGMPKRSDGKSLFAAGCDDYLQKPVAFEVLRKKIQNLLDLSKH